MTGVAASSQARNVLENAAIDSPHLVAAPVCHRSEVREMQLAWRPETRVHVEHRSQKRSARARSSKDETDREVLLAAGLRPARPAGVELVLLVRERHGGNRGERIPYVHLTELPDGEERDLFERVSDESQVDRDLTHEVAEAAAVLQ